MFSRLSKHTWFHYLLLFIGILCISWSAIFVKIAGVSGISSAFYRMFIGALGILPLWFFRRKPIKDWRSVKIAILCGLIFASDIAVWNTSIMLSKAAISTLLANLAPVWVGLGSIFILKEKPGKIFWLGTLVALIGVVIIVGISNVFNSHLNLGNTLAIIASLFYGFYLLIVKKGRVSLDTVSFTAISMIASSVFLFLICAVSGAPFGGFAAKSWIALTALGLISQLGGWLAINFALGHIRPTTASVSLLSQSVFTAIFSIPILGEFLSWIEIFGAFIVLAGIFMVTRKASPSKTSIEPEYE